jgi:hypothetical protein
MYKVTLINTQTNQPHEVGGSPVEIYSRDLDRDVEQLMRNRDKNLFRILIERVQL